jgi:hypothetical protein
LEVELATQFALPSQSFSNVQRYLTVTPRETRLAWEAYFDATAARGIQNRQLGLRAAELGMLQEHRNRQYELQQEALEREEDAAKISGITQIGSTAAILGMAYPGIGEGVGKLAKGAAGKIGIGSGAAPKLAATTAAPAVAELTATPSVASLTAAKTAGAGSAGLGTGTYGASGLAGPGGISAAAPFLGPAAGGLAAGFAGSLIGEEITGSDAGGVGGGLVGGAAAGFALSGGNPIGAIVGGVVGGAIGAVKAIKD